MKLFLAACISILSALTLAPKARADLSQFWCEKRTPLSPEEAQVAHEYMVDFLAEHPDESWRPCYYPTHHNDFFRIEPRGPKLISFWSYADEEGRGMCGPQQNEIELSK